MSKKKIARKTRTTKTRRAEPPAANDPERDYSRAGLAARINAETARARLALSAIMAAQAPATELERNAGVAVYLPHELTRIASALQAIDAAAKFVRYGEVAS